MASKNLDRAVTLKIPTDNPRVKIELEKIGRSTEKWKAKLEEGRRRARASFDEERRKRGFGGV